MSVAQSIFAQTCVARQSTGTHDVLNLGGVFTSGRVTRFFVIRVFRGMRRLEGNCWPCDSAAAIERGVYSGRSYRRPMGAWIIS